jgi:hypothetical protein
MDKPNFLTPNDEMKARWNKIPLMFRNLINDSVRKTFNGTATLDEINLFQRLSMMINNEDVRSYWLWRISLFDPDHFSEKANTNLLFGKGPPDPPSS